MAGQKQVFIGGLHRSGTTPLAQCLAEHPLVSAFSGTGVLHDEGQFLQTVYPPANVYGGPGRFGFSPEAHLTEQSVLVSDASRRRLDKEWGRHWDRSRPVLLEKSPANLIRARFLQALFPEAYFVMILRHPIAVSLATKKWTGQRTIMLHALIRHWLVCHETFERDRVHLERILVVRYEDFVADPDACLDDILSFLNLPAHPRNSEIRSELNESYFRRWHKLAATGLVLPAYVRWLEWRFEDRVRTFGYSLRDGLGEPIESPASAIDGERTGGGTQGASRFRRWRSHLR